MRHDHSTNGRRRFLKRGIVGLAGAALVPPLTIKPISAKTVLRKREFMYKILGNTKIELPIISMGVMNADNPNLVTAALDAGIIHLDTAWYYQRGRNEEMIGRVVKGRPRESYVVTTKNWEPKENRICCVDNDRLNSKI